MYDNLMKSLATFKNFKAKRFSSYDRTGRNRDLVRIEAGETATLAEIPGAGCITHIWITTHCEDKFYLRKMVLRMFWDGEKYPSLEAPLGDFFGVGHAKRSAYQSLPLNMTSGDGQEGGGTAMNCYFAMPFANGARIQVTNESDQPAISFYYYIDYEEHAEAGEDLARFHAQWRRDCPCRGWKGKGSDWHSENWNQRMEGPEGANLTGKGNYLILDARGRGHYVGCNLSIHNLSSGWWGEGDDMIFVDGEKWPPSLHGTGTEDYFCNAWGMQNTQYLFAGASLFNKKHTDWEGKWTVYRYHILDPIPFQKSIRVTIEHGSANNRSDDYSSTAYWYQQEPHRPFPPFPKVEERLPLPDGLIGRWIPKR